MSNSSLNERFGNMRSPDGTKPWEAKMVPKSKTMLDAKVAEALKAHSEACQETLLRFAPKWITFIWLVDVEGKFHIAVEELAVQLEPSNLSGAPRLRRHHPARTKKLGHPSLIAGGDARIAGQLFLDEVGGSLSWWVDCDSGRYCKQLPPNKTQKDNILAHFRSLLGADLQFDDIGATT